MPAVHEQRCEVPEAMIRVGMVLVLGRTGRS
jgi:hypothetical protein